MRGNLKIEKTENIGAGGGILTHEPNRREKMKTIIPPASLSERKSKQDPTQTDRQYSILLVFGSRRRFHGIRTHYIYP